jgi:hypothetical protein
LGCVGVRKVVNAKIFDFIVKAVKPSLVNPANQIRQVFRTKVKLIRFAVKANRVSVNR